MSHKHDTLEPPLPNEYENCRGCENEEYEDSEESDDQVICMSCKEWTSRVICSVCGDVKFDSSCCG